MGCIGISGVGLMVCLDVGTKRNHTMLVVIKVGSTQYGTWAVIRTHTSLDGEHIKLVHLNHCQVANHNSREFLVG